MHTKRSRYSAYRLSGVEGLEEIPEEWDVLAFKRLGEFQGGAGFPYNEQGLLDEEFPFYKVSDSNLSGNELFMSTHNNSVSRETAAKLRAFVFPKDTIVFAKVGAALLLNKRRILTSPSCIDNNMMGFIRKSCNLNWVYYWMHSLDLGELANPGAVPSINEGQIREIRVPVPPPEEQYAIAAYLDRETARIDALIEKKQRQIELLQEKRAALISHAVTKGLNPNAKMKDSGVEWLKEVPSHWEVKRLRYGARLQGGYAYASDKFESEGVSVVRMNNLKRGVLDVSEASYIAPENCLRDFALKEGDLLYGMSGSLGETGSLGNFARVRPCDLPAQLNQRVGRFQADENCLSPNFLVYVIQASFFYDQILLRVTGTAQFNVSSEQVESSIVAFPPLPEQRAIAAYLDRETTRIDTLVKKVKKSTILLREYRTSLISAAVTGKIDVRKEPT